MIKSILVLFVILACQFSKAASDELSAEIPFFNGKSTSPPRVYFLKESAWADVELVVDANVYHGNRTFILPDSPYQVSEAFKEDTEANEKANLYVSLKKESAIEYWVGLPLFAVGGAFSIPVVTVAGAGAIVFSLVRSSQGDNRLKEAALIFNQTARK